MILRRITGGHQPIPRPRADRPAVVRSWTAIPQRQWESAVRPPVAREVGLRSEL